MGAPLSRPGVNVLVIGAIVALSLFVLPTRNYPLEANAEASPERLARGTATTPYQYRVLVPWIAGHTADASDPAALQRRYRQIELLALLAIGFGFWHYLRRFIPARAADVAAPAIFLLLPFNYRLQDVYPYDLMAMAFTVIGLILIGERRYAWFYPLFVLATLNRETSLFLALAMAVVWLDRQPRSQTFLHLAAQVSIWVAIKGFLYWRFRNNPQIGFGLFVPQLKMNAALVLHLPLVAATALSTWGFLWVPVVARFNRIRSAELRRTLSLVPVYVAVMLVIGVMNETRIYGEMLPIVTAGAFAVFDDYLRSSDTAALPRDATT
jgi:hypothetical protein